IVSGICEADFRKDLLALIIRFVRRLRSNRIRFGRRSAAAGDVATPAPELGDAEALYELGLLLEEQHDLAGAEKAYRRADDAGHTLAACKLGVLLEGRSERAQAEAAYARADHRGDAAGAFNL